MKFQFYHEKLIDAEEYQNFKRENPGAFPCSGFFVLDKEKRDNKVHFDFYIPQYEKMYSFKLDGKVEFVPVENFDKRPFEKLSMNYTFDLEKIEEEIVEEQKKQNIKGEIKKLLFSLQKLKGIDYLVGTIFLSNMGLLKIEYNIAEKKITKIEKKSFFDMLKFVKGGNKKTEKNT
jgi:hypothetical protein